MGIGGLFKRKGEDNKTKKGPDLFIPTEVEAALILELGANNKVEFRDLMDQVLPGAQIPEERRKPVWDKIRELREQNPPRGSQERRT